MISLLAADGMVAWVPSELRFLLADGDRLSSVGPAAMGLTGSPLVGSQCNPAGFILAASLWW